MPFPTTGILDNFNRADGSVGANWSADAFNFGSVKFNISGNKAVDGGSGYSFCWWNVAQYGPDCEVYCTMPLKETVQIYLRIQQPSNSANTADGYYLENVIQSGAGNDQWKLYRVDNCVFTQLGATMTQEWTAGDSVGLQAIGSTISVWLKLSGTWTLIGSRTDATYPGAGYIGAALDNAAAQLDDFGGGTITKAPPPFQRKQQVWRLQR